MSFMKKIKDISPISIEVDPEKVDAIKSRAKTTYEAKRDDAKMVKDFVSDTYEAKTPHAKAQATEKGTNALNAVRAKAHHAAQAAADKLNKED